MFKDVYEVKYKLYNRRFWGTIREVIEDGIIESTVSAIPFRFFVTKNLTRIEIPVNGTIFKFSPERAEIIRKSKFREEESDISEK